MATTSVRRAALNALLDAIRAADSDLIVESGWPGDRNARGRMLFVAEIRSASTNPVIGAGRLQRQDEFVVTLAYFAAGYRTHDSGIEAIEAIDATVDDIVAEDSTLNELDGILSVVLGDATFNTEQTPNGVVAWGTREVLFDSRLL